VLFFTSGSGDEMKRGIKTFARKTSSCPAILIERRNYFPRLSVSENCRR
jgi:hypothetical protein